VHDLERIMGTTDHFGVPSLVAINKADLNLARCEEIVAFCAERGVQVVGRIPYDNVVTEAMVQGQPVTAYTDGPVTEALKELWSRLRDSIVSRGDLSTSHRRSSL
jgi:MinD superfamily P-loop ATPase